MSEDKKSYRISENEMKLNFSTGDFTAGLLSIGTGFYNLLGHKPVKKVV